ncbi:MAG TPA: response regulator [Spirochaetota bacterium]|nr:response regulator [Spirochaetota bacterium]
MLSERILVVERERIVAMDIDNILRGSGYSNTTLVYSYDAAMSEIYSIKPDLVLLDERIGDGKNGISAGRKIIETYQIPVLYLTSSPPSKSPRARRDRLAHFLHKPFGPDEVSSAVKKILSRRKK